MSTGPEMQISSTLLSRKPKSENVLVIVIGISALLFISMIYWRDIFEAQKLLSLSSSSILDKHEYWRLISAVFVHADLKHLLSNCVFWGWLSFLLFEYFGAFVFPISVLVLSVFTNMAMVFFLPANASLVGASGAVYVMAGIWLVLYILIERSRTVGSRIIRALGFSLVILMPSAFDPQVSYMSHAIGFGFGAVFGFIYFLVRKKWIRSFEKWKIIDPEG